MRKILGISGSPRRNGNTETLMDAALEGAMSAGVVVEKIAIDELRIKPCRSCHICSKNRSCAIKDDMRRVYRKIDDADGLIIASPIYFGSITAQLKMMIDRFEPYWVRKYVMGKPCRKEHGKGIFLCCAAEGRQAFFRNASEIVRHFFATIVIDYIGGVFCGAAIEAGDMKKDKAALKKAYGMGAKLASRL